MTFFCSVIEIIRKVASDTGFWCLERQGFRALTFFRFRIELFIQWAFITSFIFFVEKVWQWAGNTLGICLEWSTGITKTFFAC